MKFQTASLLFVTFFTVFYLSANAQTKVPMGAYSTEQTAELISGDQQLTDLRYYKNLIVELKAGEGIFLFMTSVTFVPQMYMLDNSLTNWVPGVDIENSDNTTASTLTFTADKDTSFYIIYTSTTVGAEGAFGFGSRKLDAAQMHYPESDEFCGRLTYIVNNWLCYWNFLPVADNTYLGKITYNSLLGDLGGSINLISEYSEVLYLGEEVEVARSIYADYVGKVQSCIDMEFWEMDTKTNVEFDDTVTNTTYFNLKGGENEGGWESFGISIIEDWEYGNSVVITFY